MKLGVNHVDNKYYHADKTFYSSSALKLLLKSKQDFYRKHILGESEPIKNVGALNMGTALHTHILEPHLYTHEIAVYTGGMRRGKSWDEFYLANQSKTIITASEAQKVDTMVASYEANLVAVELVANCAYEHTLCAEYDGIQLKVRCDGINLDKGYIFDVKSTAYASDVITFKETLNGLDYDLSAYMYCKVASIIYNRKFVFYFIVCSKSDNRCKVYKMSSSTMAEGKNKFVSAIDTLKNCLLTNNWSDENLELEDNETLIEEV